MSYIYLKINLNKEWIHLHCKGETILTHRVYITDFHVSFTQRFYNFILKFLCEPSFSFKFMKLYQNNIAICVFQGIIWHLKSIFYLSSIANYTLLNSVIIYSRLPLLVIWILSPITIWISWYLCQSKYFVGIFRCLLCFAVCYAYSFGRLITHA